MAFRIRSIYHVEQPLSVVKNTCVNAGPLLRATTNLPTNNSDELLVTDQRTAGITAAWIRIKVAGYVVAGTQQAIGELRHRLPTNVLAKQH